MVVTIAIPFIVLILVGKMFLTFFMPKSLTKVSKRFSKFLMGGFNRYAIYRQTKELKRRDKEFANNVGYGEVQNDVDTDETEDYVDITIHEDNNEKE